MKTIAAIWFPSMVAALFAFMLWFDRDRSLVVCGGGLVLLWVVSSLGSPNGLLYKIVIKYADSGTNK